MIEGIPQPEEKALPASPETIQKFLYLAFALPPAEPLVPSAEQGIEKLQGTLTVKNPLNLDTSDTDATQDLMWLVHSVPDSTQGRKVSTYSIRSEIDPQNGGNRLVFADRFDRPVSEERTQQFMAGLSHAYLWGDRNLN
jgi:hypothetical protein